MSNDVRSLFVNPFRRESARTAAVIALAAALVAWPALADSDYPPGLFENSPVVPGPGGAPPPGPDAAEPPDGPDPGPPEAGGPLDDYCASVAGRTFHSLDEVRRAHARCDAARRGGPLPPPGAPPDE